jgi:hypothetical protein
MYQFQVLVSLLRDVSVPSITNIINKVSQLQVLGGGELQVCLLKWALFHVYGGHGGYLGPAKVAA